VENQLVLLKKRYENLPPFFKSKISGLFSRRCKNYRKLREKYYSHNKMIQQKNEKISARVAQVAAIY